MKIRATVMLKDGVLDPQGDAVRHALGTLGFEGVGNVRQGKVIELDLDETDAKGTNDLFVNLEFKICGRPQTANSKRSDWNPYTLKCFQTHSVIACL